MMQPSPPSDNAHWFDSDASLHQLYPPFVEPLAVHHWTPLDIAFKAAQFLAVGKHPRILDIGSGVGKFCLAGAWMHPDAYFYGIEQRRQLVPVAEAARDRLRLSNLAFFRGNFTQLDFRQFDHFYFYNSFHENRNASNRIDDQISYSEELYFYYSRFLYRRLNEMPPGTRLVTFHSDGDEVPVSYQEVGVDGELSYWIKT